MPKAATTPLGLVLYVYLLAPDVRRGLESSVLNPFIPASRGLSELLLKKVLEAAFSVLNAALASTQAPLYLLLSVSG